jgi:hypothetical protein
MKSTAALQVMLVSRATMDCALVLAVALVNHPQHSLLLNLLLTEKQRTER